MNDKMHEEKDKHLFDNIANEYFKKDIYVVSKEARRFQLLSLIRCMQQYSNCKSLGRIIELGSGVGASSEYLKEIYTEYIGVDYSEEFVKIANKTFSNINRKFICGNIKSIDIAEKNVDFVFGVGVLHHVADINEVLQNIKKIGNPATFFGFIEPQSSNPFIQLMRKIRMKIDKRYSADQVFFSKKEIISMFESNDFKVERIKYQGYLSTPFAQVIMKPKAVFLPIVLFLIMIDKLVQKYLNNRFSWNICWIASKKNNN
jgi:ubiquinone/menaquinone biosynthesis C-methylase UbiE